MCYSNFVLCVFGSSFNSHAIDYMNAIVGLLLYDYNTVIVFSFTLCVH